MRTEDEESYLPGNVLPGNASSKTKGLLGSQAARPSPEISADKGGEQEPELLLHLKKQLRCPVTGTKQEEVALAYQCGQCGTWYSAEGWELSGGKCPRDGNALVIPLHWHKERGWERAGEAVVRTPPKGVEAKKEKPPSLTPLRPWLWALAAGVVGLLLVGGAWWIQSHLGIWPVVITTPTPAPTATATATTALTPTAPSTKTPTLIPTLTATVTPPPAATRTSTQIPELTLTPTGVVKKLEIVWIPLATRTSWPFETKYAYSVYVTKLATGSRNRILTVAQSSYYQTPQPGGFTSGHRGDVSSVAFSPDGGKVLVSLGWEYSASDYGHALRIMNDDGGNAADILRTGPPDNVDVALNAFKTALWSPDGQRIAVRYQYRNDFGVFLINPDGTRLRRLENSDVTDHPIFWSIDGKWIVAFSTSWLWKSTFALEVEGTRRIPLAQFGSIQVYDQTAYPWGVKTLTQNMYW